MVVMCFVSDKEWWSELNDCLIYDLLMCLIWIKSWLKCGSGMVMILVVVV